MNKETMIQYIKKGMCKNCATYIESGNCVKTCPVLEIIDELSKTKVDLSPVNPQPKMGKWIPVSDPLKELPKDRLIWVTYEDHGYLEINLLFYDMTEWSEPYIAKNAIAYMDYIEPTPYKAESEDQGRQVRYIKCEVLDEIRAEVEQLPITDTAIKLIVEIIDKYKTENEDKE